jgi:putative membrane protein
MMTILTTIVISLVLLLHLFFMVLEMFFWDSAFGREAFGLSESYARQSATLAANQGLYNGFLAAGLLWGLVTSDGLEKLIFFLSCIIIAGIYGALTAKPSIFWLQAFPAVIAMALLVFNI